MHKKRFRLFFLPFFLAALLPGIMDAQPVANFTADTLFGCSGSPLIVEFQDQSTNGPTSWFWDFGDPGSSSTSNNQNPSFIYTAPGCYDVLLVVSNAGGSDTLRRTCYIEVFEEPVPDVAVDVSEGCAPLTVNFSDASVSNAAGGNVEWFWAFSNGDVATEENPTVTFPDAPETIDILLTVENANGCRATQSFASVVNVLEAPVLDFAVDVNSACDPPLTVNITNNTNTNGATLSYTWQFPGGTPVSSNQENPPPIEYDNVGSFDVTLVASSANGCSDTLTQSGFIGIGGVTADFTTSATEVCLGEAIDFTNTSSGGVNDVEWIFGDGSSSTANNPSHVYDAPGTYTVELRANNPEGCGDVIVRTDYITVLPVPTADFGLQDGTGGCTLPAAFSFVDSSSMDVVGWLWDFGDGGTSTLQNPSHSYTSFGEFPITLTVTNAAGCDATVMDSSSVSILQPEAAFGADMTQGCIPMTVNITDNSVSADSIIDWQWMVTPPGGVDPAATSTDQNPTFTFNNTGSYTVNLMIETQTGCRDTVELQDYIQAGTPPMVDFTVSRDTVCVNDTLTFSSVFSDSAWTYSWDFMYDPSAGFNEMATAQNPPFAYPDTGLYNVALIIENSGCRDTLIRDSLVFVSPPRADFTLDPPVVCGLPGTVTVVDASIGPITTYEWFYDGNPIGGNSPDPGPIDITTLGSHTIKLKVTYEPTGCVDSTEQIIQAGNPIADFTASTLQGCKPLTVNFTNNSQNAVSYRWDLQARSVTFPNPTQTYLETGFKTVSLVAVDANGCEDTLEIVDYIEVLGPTADFSADPTVGCPPLDVQFQDLSQTYLSTTITGWAWNFGDSISGPANTSTLQNPTHAFDSSGLYPITLSVTDSDGCSDTITRQDFISVTFPDANFGVSDSITCAGNILNFQNLTQSVGSTVQSFVWDFGDGESSTEANPNHAYADTGFYSVSLIASDANGCTDTITKENFIYVEPFEVDFFGDPLRSACKDLNASFFNQSTGSIGAVEWDFGDGFTSNLVDDTVGHTYLIPGVYDVSLTVIHEDGCTDQLVRPEYVNVGGPVGSFEVLPAPAVCLGDTIQIAVYTTNTDEIRIDYRDGNVESMLASGDSLQQDTTLFTHFYDTPGRYIPLIVLIDDQGTDLCIVEIDSSATISIVSPPTAGISLSDSIGCAPTDLSLTDVSVPGDTAIASWIWKFGDGDSALLQNPVHTYDVPGLYDIELVVADSIGCADTATATFEAFPGAVADFIASDSVSCAPVDIEFTDISTGPAAIGWEWYFGDTPDLGDTIQNPVHTYTSDGLYTVTMVIFDEVGCSDTITKQDYIELRRPEAFLQSSAFAGCNPVDITFTSEGTLTDTTIANYQWCITDTLSLLSDCISSGAVDSLMVPFTEPGTFDVELVVTDAFGCVDTSESVRVSINERVVPPPIIMRSVSVNSDTSVTVNWEPYALTDFVSYVIYRLEPSGAAIAVDTLTDQLANQYVDAGETLDCSENVYCYKVLVQNTCEELSLLDATQEHCTIELTATPDIDQIVLDWTPYVGFTVAEYQIFRVASYDLGTAVPIGSVGGSVLTFTDTATFCRDSITYRVMALDASPNGEISYSDISATAPLHSAPTEPVEVLLATVEQDSFVSINWTPYDGYRPDRFLIERSLDGNAWDSLATVPLDTLSYEDFDVSVDELSYFYRVFAIDSCEDVTPVGSIGRSMLLETSLIGKNPVLSWTPYEEWPQGVLTYEIEVFNETTQSWEIVEMLPGNVLTFTDETTQLAQSTYCYRISAFEAGGQSAVSVSNEACIIFAPQVFTPNAFTPNGDGHNDAFRVFVPNLQSAELLIFDRWGGLIYRSLNLEDGWDGTFKGQHVQEGVYVFVVNGTGEDGTTFSRSGTVTLIR